MSFLRKASDGKWEVRRRKGVKPSRGSLSAVAEKNARRWYLVKYSNSKNRRGVPVGNVWVPEEFVGKRVRVVFEVLDDSKKETKS